MVKSSICIPPRQIHLQSKQVLLKGKARTGSSGWLFLSRSEPEGQACRTGEGAGTFDLRRIAVLRAERWYRGLRRSPSRGRARGMRSP